MVPTSFAQSNAVLDKPRCLTSDECEALSVCHAQTVSGLPIVVTCWKLTADELASIQRTGRVWLTVMGVTMPPVQISGECPLEESP